MRFLRFQSILFQKERDEDIIKTIELVEDLKDFKGLLVALFFVPLGRLREHDWFKLEDENVAGKN